MSIIKLGQNYLYPVKKMQCQYWELPVLMSMAFVVRVEERSISIHGVNDDNIAEDSSLATDTQIKPRKYHGCLPWDFDFLSYCVTRNIQPISIVVEFQRPFSLLRVLPTSLAAP